MLDLLGLRSYASGPTRPVAGRNKAGTVWRGGEYSLAWCNCYVRKPPILSVVRFGKEVRHASRTTARHRRQGTQLGRDHVLL